ncbi:hypothetical protein ACIRBX_04260 [Kitasatospora sp. NPDC096147]|uniref:hypothetical protein n=1 Tax=Kitasatospora sp. NPDC096147 TaxID=3364093 RepID=UPI003812B439
MSEENEPHDRRLPRTTAVVVTAVSALVGSGLPVLLAHRLGPARGTGMLLAKGTVKAAVGPAALLVRLRRRRAAAERAKIGSGAA